VRAAVGVADVFRLPKFSYWFYRSQRDAHEGGAGWSGGPVVFIASHWTAASNLRVVVFSNCEEVQLRINGVALGRRRPDLTWHTQKLPHPPFVFDLPRFVPGVLEATGYIGGVVVTTHLVRTPEPAASLELSVDDLGIVAAGDEPDVLIAHARIVDMHGTLCVTDTREVAFTLEGEAEILGPSTLAAEAGVASVVLRVPAGCRGFVLNACAPGELFADHVWGDVVDMASIASPG
jgi:beta-galactosidase